ncbi:MBL fold hydrolase [Spirochaetia bacterium]|nr:MBL fold hydrolase [Spirochaetia bacterium]
MGKYQIIQLVLGDISTNCWIIVHGETCTVIDPADQAEIIIAQLEKLNAYPENILLTHGHFDHIGALPDLAAYQKSGVEKPPVIAIHRDDAGYLGKGAYALRLLEEGDTIGPLTVLHLPGHTPGSAGFFLEDEKTLFSGDTLFYGNCGRVDLPGGSQEKIEASLKRLMAMDPAIRVLPGHGPETTIGQEQGTRFF